MTRLSLASAVFAALLALSACGSDAGSSDASTEATTSTVADDATTTTVETQNDTADAVDDGSDDGLDGSDDGTEDGDVESDDSSGKAITSLDELPSECREVMGDFLRAIEPTVSQVDWETATMADMERLTGEIDTATTDFDTRLEEAGCDDFEPGDDDTSFAIMIELAEKEAPGTVGWLMFIETFVAGFDDEAATSADVPADCDGALAYVENLTTDAETMMELPMGEVMNVGAAVETIQSECSLEQSAAFFEEYADFFGG